MKIIIDQECIFTSPNAVKFRPAGELGGDLVSITLNTDGTQLRIAPVLSEENLAIYAANICNQINNIKIPCGSTVEYAGVSDTPFISLAAYELKKRGIQLEEIEFWHNYRDVESELQGWNIMSHAPASNKSNPVLHHHPEKLSCLHRNGDCIITFSSSFPVSKDNLSGINTRGCDVFEFDVRCPGVDSIFSKTTALIFAQEIKERILSIQAQNSNCVKRIHLVMSTSVSMTFCLAYMLIEPYMPRISIYHYDAHTKNKRSWGIDFSGGDYAVFIK